MRKDIKRRVKNAALKSWLMIAGLWGVGFLPCPDCGAPMVLHFWPLALVLTLFQLRRDRQSRCDPPPAE